MAGRCADRRTLARLKNLNSQLYTLEGDFLEVDSPRTMAHTWYPSQAPAFTTTVRYRVDPLDITHTRVTLWHTGFSSSVTCTATCIAWETSFARLAEIIARDE